MNCCDILFLLILAFTGLGGQEILLTVPKHDPSTTCVDGFRAEVDQYSFTGTVGPNYTALYDAGWNDAIKIEVLPVGATTYLKICDVLFGDKGQFCGSTSTGACYCNKLDTTSGLAHFVINSITKAAHSNGTVRGEWLQGNKPAYHSNGQNLPGIYDEKDAVLTLTVIGAPPDTAPGSCGLSFTANKQYTARLCCSKAAMPCYPRLAFNGTDVGKVISPCVEYTFTANKTVNVTKSYSVCNSSDYTGGFCLIQTSSASSTAPPDNTTVPGTDNTTVAPNSSSSAVTGTDNTTATPNSSSSTITGTDNTTATPNSSSSTVTGTDNTTAKPNSTSTVTETPHKDSNFVLGLVLGLVLGISAVFIGVVLCIYFWKKKLYCWKKQATGHDSAKGSEAPTHVDENIDLKTTGKENKPSDGRQNKDQGNKNAGAIEHEGNQDTSR
jgi:hypothetical protein